MYGNNEIWMDLQRGKWHFVDSAEIQKNRVRTFEQTVKPRLFFSLKMRIFIWREIAYYVDRYFNRRKERSL